MELENALKGRRSIRQFKADPVPMELVRACLEDATHAPSWSNTQPYRVAVAQGAVRDALARELGCCFDQGMALQRAPMWRKAWAWLSGGVPRGEFRVPLRYPADLQEARRATGFGLYGALGIDRADLAGREGQMRRNWAFFDAPVVVFVFAHEGLGAYAALDAGLFLQSFLLACHARGLGTCAQGALAVWPGPVRSVFGVPAQYKLLVGCSVGYAADHPVNAFNPGRASVDTLLLGPR